MNDIEFNECIKNLNCEAPQYLQDYAISRLINIDDSKLHLLLQPISKSYWRNAANVLKKIGYPRVKSIIPGLLQWVKDMNWPGAQEIVDLLITIDDEIVPYIKQALKSSDGIWIMWILSEVVSKWNRALINQIKNNLLELTNTLNTDLIIEGVDIQAMELLYASKYIDKNKLLSVIKRKGVLYQELLENLEEFRRSIE